MCGCCETVRTDCVCIFKCGFLPVRVFVCVCLKSLCAYVCESVVRLSSSVSCLRKGVRTYSVRLCLFESLPVCVFVYVCIYICGCRWVHVCFLSIYVYVYMSVWVSVLQFACPCRFPVPVLIYVLARVKL